MNQPAMNQHPAFSPSSPWLGRSVGDRYRLEQCLGSGGMGDVFLATDTRLGKSVALKLLKEALAIAADVTLTTRFERECAICAALKSVHIVQVSDYGLTSEGYPFYVMEYLQGQTLSQYLSTHPRLSIEETGKIITQVCAGLHVAHTGVTLWNRETNTSEQIKVVHRDLKPDNIFLTPTALGELVKIIDFGIAKIHSLQAELTSATNVFLGTCHYASPEQSDGGAVDERSDIYSLGVILYEMLTGIDPFGLDFKKNRITNNAWLAAHAFKPPQPMRSHPHCQNITPELEAVVLRCLAKSPDDRFASVNELRLALQQAIAVPSRSDLDVTHYSTAHVNDAKADAATQMRQLSSLSISDPIPVTRQDSIDPAIARPSVIVSPKSSSHWKWGIVAMALLAITGVGVCAIPQLQSGDRVALPFSKNQELALSTTIVSGSQSVNAVSLSADGQTLISGNSDSNGQTYPITIWQVSDQQTQQTLDGHTGAVRSLSLRDDGQILASGSDDRTIRLWNLQTGTLIRTLNQHTAPVLSVALSRDGQTLISGSDDGTVRLWNVQTGESRSLLAHTKAVHSVAISPDGQFIASSGADKTIRLWNGATGELIRTLGEPGGHRDVISSVVFSPDGQQLVSGSWDKSVKVWNVATGQLLQTLEGHTDRVTGVVFVNPQTIATASFDHTIQLWDVQTGRSRQTLSDHTSRVLALSSTQSRSLVSSSSDATIKIWR